MKRRISGTVISDRMDKTRVVEVVRDVVHPVYKKRYKVSKHFYAHDEANVTKQGDVVVIEESRPLSKLKRWRIVEKVGAGSQEMEAVSPVREEGEERALPDRVSSARRARGKGKPRVSPHKEVK